MDIQLCGTTPDLLIIRGPTRVAETLFEMEPAAMLQLGVNNRVWLGIPDMRHLYLDPQLSLSSK